MAAMDATLEVMEREDVPSRSAERGRQLRAGLDRLFARHEWIGEVRGMGLMQAMELVEHRGTKEPSPKKAAALLRRPGKRAAHRHRRMYCHVIRMAPQMLMSEAEIADGLERLSRACSRVG
jgi:4-aminobutyrate aminotransferase-like enzyme